jgi:hypothetical protein
LLFSYKPIEHYNQIENYHVYINYFFTNLFVCEPDEIDTLIHDDFEVMYNSHYGVIRNNLQSIHQQYLVLTDTQKSLVQNAFNYNQQIENICSKVINPIQYSDLEVGFATVLKIFFDKSWILLSSKNGNPTVKDKCGNIYQHYCNLFIDGRQNFTICPVCGLEELLGEYDACNNPDDDEQEKAREAYDHYFPKKLYPFISVDFTNLLPICHHCNSTYKHEFDTAYEGANRQACFYPFSLQEINPIRINIDTLTVIDELKSSSDWSISLDTDFGVDEEINSWDNIFRIKSRYIKRIKGKESVWKNRLITQVRIKLDEMTWDDFKIEMYKDIEILNQTCAVIQKSYYDYFFTNLLPSYIEENE